MNSEIRAALSEIAELLEKHQEHHYASAIRDALHGPEKTLETFLASNELWGGSGSIADNSLIPRNGDHSLDGPRATLEGLLIHLGGLQMDLGYTNVRTETWVNVFEEWRRKGVR
jgi:hypothetical protein